MKLNNIIKIEKIVAENLLSEKVSLKQIIVDPQCVFTKVDCVTPVSVEITSTDEDHVHIYTSKMKLVLLSDDDLLSSHLAFRLTAASGKKYILGDSSRPWAMITETDTHPDKVKNPQGKVVNVEYRSVFPLMEIRQ